MIEPAVPAVSVPEGAPKVIAVSVADGAAKAGVMLLMTAAISMEARIVSRVPVLTRLENNFFVCMLFSLAHYGQVLGVGGSTRRYVIGPDMV